MVLCEDVFRKIQHRPCRSGRLRHKYGTAWSLEMVCNEKGRYPPPFCSLTGGGFFFFGVCLTRRWELDRLRASADGGSHFKGRGVDIWNGIHWCGEILVPILRYRLKIWYKITRLWHDGHRP